MPPPPCFAWSHSPAPFHCAVAEMRNRSRDALPCPSYAHHHDAIPKIDSPPANKGRLSAERRIVLPIAACAAAHPDQMRPPSGTSPRHSPGRTHPALAQPQNRVSRHLELTGVLPAYILASVKRAPRGPVLVPVDRCPRAARERIAFIRARAPHSLRLSGMPAGQTPLR